MTDSDRRREIRCPGRRSIADLVDVNPAETVVRLDGSSGRLRELVLTGDVVRSLGAVLERARGETGAGFLVVGHFGSGKSHFLAAVGELLAEPSLARGLAAWDGRLSQLAASARPSLPVPVPLVEYRADASLEDVVWRRAWQALQTPAPAIGTDHVESWGRFLAAALSSGRAGLVFLIDELSEFLKAKRGPALTEDLRFLQFFGEWPTEHPVLVVGALQENIEEVASVSQTELARIRDRYPTTLGLSMRHVQDLVRGRLVRLRPGAEADVERAYRELKAAFPSWPVPLDAFLSCYPLHPDTLGVLDGLRFLFSQQRGVVDFICRQLRGDLAAGIEPWQEREYMELVTPDRIYDHFRSRLHERVETNRLADTVVPYYEHATDVLFDSASDRRLGLRAVKLLALLAASALERRRTGRELAEMLLTRVSALDPQANYSYLDRAVLGPLAAHGAYVVARGSPPATTYSVELEADASLTARTRLEQLRTELTLEDRRPIETLTELGSSHVLPLGTLRRSGRGRRDVIWQNTLRSVVVTSARLADLTPGDSRELLGSLEGTGAEVCLVVAEPEPSLRPAVGLAEQLAEESERLAVWLPDALTDAEVEFAFELFCRRVLLEQARQEGQVQAGGLVDFLQRSAESDASRAREIVHRCYFQGGVVSSLPGVAPELPSLSGLSFERVLPRLVAPVLHGLHPRHQQVQPLAELVGERLLRQLTDVLTNPRISIGAADRGQVRHLIESYLVPIGVMRRRGDAYVIAPDPVRSPAVAELQRLVAGQPRIPAADVLRGLRESTVGLTEAEALIVMNGAVQGGMIQAHRRGRQPNETFLSAAEAGVLSLGELVAPELRAKVAELAAMFGPGPYEPWNARVQSSAWEHAVSWLEARREETAELRQGIERLGDTPFLAEADLGPVRTDLGVLEAVIASGRSPAHPRDGLEAVLQAIPEPATVLAAAGRAGALARFLRTDLRSLETSVDYLTHTDLVIPEGAGYARLSALRSEALELAQNVLALAAEDRAREFFSASERFRQAYVAAYEEEHQAFYSGSGERVAQSVRSSPVYQALAAFADVGVIAVPDDRVKVDRALAASTPEPCRRRVQSELIWRPLCACGFRLGGRPPSVDAAALLQVASHGLAEHLAELGGEESRARLERASDDLASLERTEAAADLRRLLELSAAPQRADAAALTQLLGPELRATLREVLSGRQIVVRRDLAQLREDLIGRRYPRRRLVELVEAWISGTDEGEPPPERAFIEVVDSGDVGRAAGGLKPEPPGSATVSFLRARFPRLAEGLPGHRPVDAFWLAAWWRDRPGRPAWIPSGLANDDALAAAATAAVGAGDPEILRELGELDQRVGPRALLGDQVTAALDLPGSDGAQLAGVLFGERLLRHPVRLAAGELLRRLAGDWQLFDRLPAGGLERLRVEHALLGGSELKPLGALLEAAGCLARLEKRLAGLTCPELVEEVYPECLAPVAGLVSEAEAGLAGGSLLDGESVTAFKAGAERMRRAAEGVFLDGQRSDFSGCLRIWEVGAAVIEPLLRSHDRVAVLLVDAMRADLWLRLRELLWQALTERRLTERWAVVPAPTRTAEAMAALYLGRPVPEGSLAPGEMVAPFPGLGYEARALTGGDRDFRAEDLREFWAAGPRLSVVVASGVDERLHHTPVELAGLLEESVAALARRVVQPLQALPSGVPLVVLADHGFRENPAWGRGREGRYTHGGLSLEESVVPVATLV